MFENYIQKGIRVLFSGHSRATWWCIYTILIVCLILINFGYCDPIIKFLDSDLLTFKFATVSFSIYKLIKSAVLLIVFFRIARFLHEVVERNINKISQITTVNKAILTKIFQLFIYFTILIIVLDLHGIDLSAFAFLGGAVGIGVGFGLQKITSNFLSGMILLFEQSIKEGDLIELGTGVSGLVKYTGARYTLVETFNGQEIMIPNDEFITNRVTNWTYSNKRGRIEIKIGISYDSDIEKARELMILAATEHKNSSKYTLPKCHLVEFADSAIELLLFFWLENIMDGSTETKSDVMRAIWRSFKKNNIIMPFPQYDIHIKK